MIPFKIQSGITVLQKILELRETCKIYVKLCSKVPFPGVHLNNLQ